MFSDRIFQIAFIISLIAHGAILVQNSNLNFPVLRQNKEQNPEVKYVKAPPEEKKVSENQPLKKEPLLKLPLKITADNRIPPPFIDKESIFKDNNKKIASANQNFIKPALIKPDIIAIKKKITLPAIDMDKINNPSYISYYQIIREKIKRAAYQNYTGSQVGEVAVSFIVSNEGYLKEIRLSEEKSSPSAYLREIALKSIKDASPFPNYPKELEFQQLSFNLVITFEIE
jgi:TonB family protein